MDIALGTAVLNAFSEANIFAGLANQVPEPGTLALLGLALSGLALMRRRRNK